MGSTAGEAWLVHHTAQGRELLTAQEHCTDHGANAPRITHRVIRALTGQDGVGRGRDHPSQTLSCKLFN